MIWALAVAAIVNAEPSPFEASMARVAAAYAEAEFDVALAELRQAERAATTEPERVRVLLCRGITLANIPKPDEANAAWEQALAKDPGATLPLPVNTKVRAAFERVQQTVQRISQARLVPPPVAPEPSSVTPPATEVAKSAERPPSLRRWVAAGVSLGAGVISAGVGAWFGAAADRTIGQVRAATFADEQLALYSNAQRQALGANLSFALSGVFALTAIVLFAFLGD